ncbi:hypothetical protein KCV03_g284, partial [Aureobasidium melanogenum]
MTFLCVTSSTLDWQPLISVLGINTHLAAEKDITRGRGITRNPTRRLSVPSFLHLPLTSILQFQTAEHHHLQPRN